MDLSLAHFGAVDSMSGRERASSGSQTDASALAEDLSVPPPRVLDISKFQCPALAAEGVVNDVTLLSTHPPGSE